MIALLTTLVLTTAPMIPVGNFEESEIVPAAQALMTQVADGERQVFFRIDSFGGSVWLGLKFIQLVDEARKAGVRVSCVVDGKAMSMGFVFLQAACDDRWMTRHSVLLAHQGSSAAAGTAEELREAADILDSINTALAATCAERMGMSVQSFLARISKRAWVMASPAALRAHAVDGLVSASDLPPVLSL